MKISSKSRYGVRACYYLATRFDEGCVVSLTEISTSTGISSNYLEQLFIPLKRAKLVTAVRGAMGGYALSRQPSDITIGQIMRALEDGLELVGCISGECDSKAECPTFAIWDLLYHGINDLLDGLTLGDMLTGNLRRS